MKKWAILHVLLLVSILILSVVFRLEHRTHDDPRLVPLLLQEKWAEVRRVHVGPLEMVYDNGRWMMASAGNYPVDVAMINRLLRGLSKAEKRAEKTSDPEKLHRIGLAADEGLMIRLKAADDSMIYMLQLGLQEARADYGGLRSFVNLGGRAWAVSHLPRISSDIADWVDPIVLSLATGRIQALEIDDQGARSVRLFRDGPDAPFRLQGSRKALKDDVEYLLSAPQFMSLRDVRLVSADKADMFKPVRTLDWFMWDGLQLRVFLEQAADDSIWVRFEAIEGEPLAKMVAELDAPVDQEVAMLNARWSGFRFRLDDEKTADLMLSRAALVD